MSENAFAEIALGLPIDRIFSYRIPERLKNKIAIGKRAWIPFRNERKIGYVVGLNKTSEIEEVKTIYEVIDEEPIMDQEFLNITKKTAEYYLSSWGQAIEAGLPAALRKGRLDMGYKEPKTDESYPSEPQKTSILLNAEQERALKLVLKSLKERKQTTFLLYGITASGKTEIYLRAIKKAIELGMSSIVLVPEISLTPQTVDRFKARFGDSIAVLHSRLSEGIRFREWKRIKQGEAKVVIGARSAIFSPVKNLGVIIIDEEHETTYKQEEAPRYHTREVAAMRAEYCKCALILGSATPLVESYYRAKSGEFKLLKLTKRIEKMTLPKITVVDMKKELSDTKKISVFSRVLKNKIEDAIKKNGQIILFLNRRGFSTFVSCRKCGFVVKCSRCDSIMVYHFTKQKLICHWCNFSIFPPKICPSCKSNYIRYFGIGTEKVEEELRKIFPYARIGRMDRDTTKKRGTHAKILGDFRRGAIQVLIGTQMIAKGLDFPNVTLVGVISADTALNLPDFRASERTFSLLTQVSGRAGRGDLGGEVIIQTYAPNHYAITSSIGQDYEKFYENEIKSRKELGLPPFYHLVRITLQGYNDKSTLGYANELADILRKHCKEENIFILGPVEAFVARLRGRYRWNIIIRGKDVFKINSCLKQVFDNYKKGKGITYVVDVDPMSI